MTDPSPVIYGLENRARALSTQYPTDVEAIRFLVGTQSFRGTEHRGNENQIHLVEYDEELNTTRKNVFSHSIGEIWNLAASPTNPLLFATCYNRLTGDTKSDLRACLWKIPFEESNQELRDDGVVRDLVKLSNLGTEENGDIKYVLFSPNEDNYELVTIGDTNFHLWDIEKAISTCTVQLKNQQGLEAKGNPRFTSGRWDPHHRATQIATANDCCVRGWDLRANQQTYVIENAHGQLVRDIDFNPNRQYIIATCGDDCRTKFWDIRNSEKPLKMLDNHSHWVWSVRFNHFHDQLVLTASSDSRVILNNVSSISSEPYGKLIDDADDDNTDDNVYSPSTPSPLKKAAFHKSEQIADGIVQIFEEHEDSVYAVEWSSSDPWVFASLSYDGRLVFNHVPRTEKYRILL